MKTKAKMALAVIFTLFVGAPLFATSVFSGEVFNITGFDNANATAKFWAGSFTIGSAAGGSLWNVSAFAVDPLNCLTCTPSSPPWTLTSFQFDSATSDLSGMAQANFNGLHLGVHLLTLTFVNGNNTSDPWSDLNKFGGTKTGTFSYCLGINCTNPTIPPAPTPEPSSLALFAGGLLGLAGVLRRKLRV